MAHMEKPSVSRPVDPKQARLQLAAVVGVLLLLAAGPHTAGAATSTPSPRGQAAPGQQPADADTRPEGVASSALEVLVGEELEGPQEAFESPGGATFTWRVPERYRLWPRAWRGVRTIPVDDPTPHRETVYGYSRAYVHPNEWPVTLDGCRTEAPDDGGTLSFSWTIARDGETITQLPDSGCEVSLSLPEDGTYSVTLVARSTTGWRDVLTANIAVDDLVVVSLGDSSASGEGNPDDPGLSPGWVDRRCHRSRTSGHALAARALERASEHSSVTFLSFACSGAELGPGVLEPYAGQDAIGSSTLVPPERWEVADLPAQVDALREALCSVPLERCTPEDMRPVDLLFVAVGLNDLSFADVLTVCADLDIGLKDLLYFPKTIVDKLLEGPCDEDVNLRSALGNAMLGLDTIFEPTAETVIPCDLSDAEWEERLGYVPSEPPPYCFDGHQTYGELRRRLETAGIVARRGVYLTTYPVEPFSMDDGDIERGCGVFRFINEGEAEFLSEVGHEFDTLIHREAIRNGFHSVGGITRAFRGHGYCAGGLRAGPVDVVTGLDSYFVPFAVSLVGQGDIDGTIHPNARGHRAIADAVLAAVAARKEDRRPTHRATVTVERVRFDVPAYDDIAVELASDLVPFEAIRNAEISDDEDGFELVAWKWAHDGRRIEDVQPGVWIDPDVPPLRADLSPADDRLRFTAFATLRASGTPTLRRARPLLEQTDDIPGGGQVEPGDGAVDFFSIRREWRPGSEGWERTAGGHRVRSEVDFGNNRGSMTVEYCVAISPIRVGPVVDRPEQVNCLPQLVER